MSFLENLGYILVGFVIIVAVFLILLSFVEKKLKIKIFQGRSSRNQAYISKLAKIDINSPEESMKELDRLGKAFFKETFRLSGSPDYSTLVDFFAERNNKLATEFSEEMTKLMYSGLQPTVSDVQSLVILLAEIVSKNKILSKDEKEDLDKKSMEKNPQKKTFKDSLPIIGKKKK